jgi:sugar phosphate isomerase/epimerase
MEGLEDSARRGYDRGQRTGPQDGNLDLENFISAIAAFGHAL